MVGPYELRELTARLGEPHLEQLTHQQGETARLLVHWGCGCTAIGAPSVSEGSAELRWSRCDHHAGEAVLARSQASFVSFDDVVPGEAGRDADRSEHNGAGKHDRP